MHSYGKKISKNTFLRIIPYVLVSLSLIQVEKHTLHPWFDCHRFNELTCLGKLTVWLITVRRTSSRHKLIL